ncbi:MAG: AAA family ATPase [Candidatus Obscuribacterales bacterium]|nr:AAA family ATPase [Candidatus Obscuribacterales bacterium]
MSKDKDDNTPRPVIDPFGKGTGAEQFFKHNQLEELQTIVSASINQKVLAAITGPPGVGKTTAARSVTDALPGHKYSVVYLGQDQNGTNLLRRLADSLGIQPRRYRTQLAMQISQWLLDNLSGGGKDVVLVVDEAHLLEDATLEELRLMTNADYDRQSPITLILLGQPALRHRLKSATFEALSQRLRYRYCLEGLDQDETIRYIQLRLAAAGVADDLFSQDALLLVFQLSEGVLRRINNLCSLALLKAKSQKRTIIDAAFIKEISELD